MPTTTRWLLAGAAVRLALWFAGQGAALGSSVQVTTPLNSAEYSEAPPPALGPRFIELMTDYHPSRRHHHHHHVQSHASQEGREPVISFAGKRRFDTPSHPPTRVHATRTLSTSTLSCPQRATGRRLTKRQRLVARPAVRKRLNPTTHGPAGRARERVLAISYRVRWNQEWTTCAVAQRRAPSPPRAVAEAVHSLRHGVPVYSSASGAAAALHQPPLLLLLYRALGPSPVAEFGLLLLVDLGCAL